MSARLQGKVALVTGSSQGIGKAVARLFVAEGAKVILNGLTADAASDALMAELGDDNAIYVAADIADEAAVQAMAARGAERFGPINVLINNAGMNVFAEPLEMTSAQWQRCFAVDLDGALHCSRAVLPGMLVGGGGGSIVNIASVHGHRIIPNSFPYPVAKHALIGMTKALGIQYAAQNVRVNSISPGLILSERIVEWLASMPPEERQRQVDLLPPKRIGEPIEVAYTALFLASDEARFINATDILIDGGRAQLYHD